MKPWIACAFFALGACTSRQSANPCQGIVPENLGESITVENVPADLTPFADAYVGDGTGSVAILASTFPRPRFNAAIFDAAGNVVAARLAQSADSFHLRILPQRSGYQLLTGDTINTARLETLSPAGDVEAGAELQRALTMSSVIDPRGGSMVLAVRIIPGAPQNLVYPWRLYAHRFDEKGAPRHPPVLVASDLTGSQGIIDLEGAVNTNGRAFAVWAVLTKEVGGPFPISGAWLSQEGVPETPFLLGEVQHTTNLNAEPLLDGSIAIAADLAWRYRVRDDGQNRAEDAGWLSSFPRTRISPIRGGRAYAVLIGDPFWQDAGFSCQSSVPISLVSKDGAVCGTITMPVPSDVSGVCEVTVSSAALGRDGSVVLRTLEKVRDMNGTSGYKSSARWWPRLLQ